MKMFKLLTIGHSYVVSLNRSLMRELSALGRVDVTVGAPQFFHGDLRSLEVEPEPQNSRVKVVPLKTYLSDRIHFFAYNPRQLSELIQSQKFDHCYLWEEPYIVSGFQVARELQKNKIPYSIFSAQNILKKYPWPFSYFESKALRGAEQIWPCGTLVQRCLEQKGFTDVPMSLLPLPVNLQHFKPMTSDQKNKAREKLKLPGQKVIGFMGRLTPEKGCRVFMRVTERLLQNPLYSGLVIGSGPLESEVKKWASQFAGRVQVVQALHSEVPDILPLMDVLLCPSQKTSFWLEQFGRMLVEAMACGVPVVGSRSGEIPFVIDEAGLIVEPTHEDAWFESAKQILESQEIYERLVQKGLLRAQYYSASFLAKNVEKNLLAGVSNIK